MWLLQVNVTLSTISKCVMYSFSCLLCLLIGNNAVLQLLINTKACNDEATLPVQKSKYQPINVCKNEGEYDTIKITALLEESVSFLFSQPCPTFQENNGGKSELCSEVQLLQPNNQNSGTLRCIIFFCYDKSLIRFFLVPKNILETIFHLPSECPRYAFSTSLKKSSTNLLSLTLSAQQ